MGHASLLQLILMAWYARPLSWAHCGYPGPPQCLINGQRPTRSPLTPGRMTRMSLNMPVPDIFRDGCGPAAGRPTTARA